VIVTIDLLETKEGEADYGSGGGHTSLRKKKKSWKEGHRKRSVRLNFARHKEESSVVANFNYVRSRLKGLVGGVLCVRWTHLGENKLPGKGKHQSRMG